MVLVSALAHLAAVVVIVLLPDSFNLRPHPLTAYTVDLVSSDQLAGTNLVPGNKGKGASPPKVEPKPAPPPPKVEEAKKPEPEPKKEEPPPKKEAPKPADEKAVAIAAATQPKPAQPTATPVVQAKAVAPPATAEAKPTTKAKPSPAAVAAAVKPTAKKEAGPPTPTKEELAASARDQQIAKAIARVQQEGKGGGTDKEGKEKGGGPISLGAGHGPGGGVVMGIEYLIYRNQLESRLKQSWAWAGNHQLEAVVRFRIAADGQIFDVRITRSSGDSAYDESVLRAVRAINPLSPPPEAYRKEFSDVEYTFTPENMG
jgi:colicin import membrane protein